MEQVGQLKNNIIFGIIFVFSFTACNNEAENKSSTTTVESIQKIKTVAIPDFNADSAYSFVQDQVDFGPRVPGTTAHAKCAVYLNTKLTSYGFDVQIQSATIKTHDNKQYILKNVIGTFNGTVQKRVLLCAHWDTRPWADKADKDRTKPFDGANDGGSGVGVILEIARQISLSNPTIGIDVIFFDLEDYGEMSGNMNSWCLGSQYWAKNLHKSNYYADYGILLDMVGAPNALFYKESNSENFANNIVSKVWNTGRDLGYNNHFIPQSTSFVGVDDHLFVNQMGIPCIDIIEYNPDNRGFGEYHHTHEDNMDVIDKNTLKAVGQTLLTVLYSEK